jgi:hypothetical protein
VGCKRPPMQFRAVVFPHPEGPRRATNSPRLTTTVRACMRTRHHLPRHENSIHKGSKRPERAATVDPETLPKTDPFVHGSGRARGADWTTVSPAAEVVPPRLGPRRWTGTRAGEQSSPSPGEPAPAMGQSRRVRIAEFGGRMRFADNGKCFRNDRTCLQAAGAFRSANVVA